jgi:hypothetical protein
MAAFEAIILSRIQTDERTLQLLLASLCLVAALLVAAVIIALVGRWRRQSDAQEDLSPNAQLAHFRSLYEAGTISAEEYERLRTVLSAQVRQSLGVGPSPTAEPSPPPAPSPPETGIQRPEGSDSSVRPA